MATRRAIFKPLSERFVVRPIYCLKSKNQLKEIWEELPAKMVRMDTEGNFMFNKKALIHVELQLEQVQFFSTPPLFGPNANLPAENVPAVSTHAVQLTRKEYYVLTSIRIFKHFSFTLEEIYELVFDY